MKTKAEIVQELLNSGKLSAADAVVLLTKEVEYIYYPSVPYIQPYVPNELVIKPTDPEINKIVQEYFDMLN